MLAVPPIDESAIFTQIPLSKDLLPLDDLGASGGYDRQLILPDDVPPVLALPWALGPKLPRVNKCEDNGALWVYQKGGPAPGDGISATTPQRYQAQFDQNPIHTANGSGNANVLGNLENQAGYYTALQIDVLVEDVTAMLAGTRVMPFYLQSRTIQDYQLPLCSITVPHAAPALGTYPCWFSFHIPFSPPMDVARTFNNETDVAMYVDNASAKLTGSWTGFSYPGQKI